MRAGSILLLAAAGLGAGACDDVPAAPAYPAGTVLAVAGAPIPGAEVEEAVARVRLVYPSRSREHLVASALESFVLPRAALRHAYPDARAEARRACEAAWERIQAGLDPGAAEHRGSAAELSLELWALGRELEPGGWSGPSERIGAFSLVQLVDREGFEQRASEERLTIRVLEFSYLPPTFTPDDLDAVLGAARLEIVDPAYETLVPELLRYRMKGRTDS